MGWRLANPSCCGVHLCCLTLLPLKQCGHLKASKAFALPHLAHSMQ